MSPTGKLAVYRRTEESGEKRLYNNYSIGFGGHVAMSDVELSKTHNEEIDVCITLYEGSEREITEEVVCKLTDFEIVGFIYDSSNEVGQVHLGIVFCFNCQDEEIKSNEDHLAEVFFDTVEHIGINNDDTLENWSKFIIDYMLQNAGEQAENNS